jgi:chromosomal replication initiation ATPase DnaA
MTETQQYLTGFTHKYVETFIRGKQQLPKKDLVVVTPLKPITDLLWLKEEMKRLTARIKKKMGRTLNVQYLNDRIVITGDKTEYLDINIIRSITCNTFNITIEELNAPCKKRELSDVRKIIAYLSRKYCIGSYSPTKIGLMLDRNHSTIINNLRDAEKLIDINDWEFTEKMTRAERAIVDYRNSLNN